MSSSSTETTVDVTMPQMGVSVAEGTVVAWRVQPGEAIEADETICEISTDKIDTEVPSPASGVVTEILVPAGTTVAVGEVLARIAGGAAAGATPGASPAPSPAGEHQADADAPDGASAADAAEPSDTTAPGSAEPARTASPNGASAPRPASARYSPVVQRIAAEHGVDLSQVEGTGRGGRVRKQDVLAFVEASPKEEPPLHIESPYRPDPVPPATPASPGAGVAQPGSAPLVPGGSGELSRMRRQIGEHMKRSLETAATCTTWIEVDLTRVQLARKRLGVTALAFVARATIEALRDYPGLNAWLEGDHYTRHPAVNLGIAVSLSEDGLIVPVIRDAHELSVEGLAARVRDLAARARARQLTPDDVRGGTFTITNPGQYGSMMATPIINQPQVAILDLEAITKRPVVVTDSDGNDSIAIRSMTILGLSWDHRALDGAESAQFLAAVKRRLEAVT